MRHPNEIITSRIPRQELVGLLETMIPFEQQRVTAEHEVVDVAEIIASLPADIDVIQRTSTLELTVRFSPPARPPAAVTQPTLERRTLPSWVLAITVCALTLLLSGLMMAAA